MTAYKYVARDAESRVNWGDISKTWSDAILKVEEDREAKRQTIKTETDELSNKLIAAPMGDHEGVNEWTSGYASMMQDALLDRYRLLTSGDLSVRDWNSYIANAKQSTDRMFDLSKAYTTNYEEKMRRYNDEESQQAELAAGEEFEGFTNFTNTVALVDPVTLSARIGKKVYDPETGTYKVGETVTMNEMYNFIQGRYDRFKVQENMATEVDFMKEYTEVVMEDNPAVKTRSDATQDPMFDEQLKSRLSVYLSDGQNVSSILTDSINEGYESTFITDSVFNPDGSVNEKKVLWVLDPRQPNSGAKTPLSGLDLDGMTEEQLDVLFGADLDEETRRKLIDVAKDQKGQAETFLTTYVKSGINMIETPKAEFPTSTGATRTTAGERGLLRQGEAGLRSLEKLHGGDEKEASEGLQNLLDRSYSIFSEGTVTIDEETGERMANLVRYNPDTKQKEVNSIPIPASLLRTIDAFGGQFFEESVRPHLYEAYDTTERLFGGIPGTATPSVSRPRAVSADNLAGEVIEIMGKEIDVATALGILKPEKNQLSTSGDKLAASNQSTLSSISAQLDLGGEFKVLLEDDMEENLGFDPKYTAVTMRFPGVSDFEVVILNNTEGVNAQKNLFDEMSKRKLRGETMTVEEIMSYLPADSKKLNEAANHSKIASGTSAIKLTLPGWKEANAAAIAGKTAAEINRMYAEYYKQ